MLLGAYAGSSEVKGLQSDLEVIATGAPDAGSCCFYASAVIASDDATDRQSFLEVGWADASWKSDDSLVYVYDGVGNNWLWVGPSGISQGDTVSFAVPQDSGSVWKAWIYWNGQWAGLTTVDLGYTKVRHGEQMGLVDDDGTTFEVNGAEFSGSTIGFDWT